MSRSSFGNALALAPVLALALASPALADENLTPPDFQVASRLLDPGTEPTSDLLYRWTEGQTETAAIELWVARSDSLGTWKTEEYAPIPFRLDVHAEVQRVDPDGSALVEYRVDDVELLAPATDEAARAMLADLETLRDVTVREEYDRKGFKTGELLIDPFEDRDDLHPARSLALSTFQGAPWRLPLEPIGVGGSWEEVSTSDVPGEAVTTETNTKRVEAIGEDGRVRISSSGVFEVPEQEVPAQEMGLDEPARAWGEGVVAQEGVVDLSSVFAAWSGTYDSETSAYLPVGDGVTFVSQTALGGAVIPAGWEATEWLALPPIDPSLVPAEPTVEPLEVAADAAHIEVVVLDSGAEPRQELRYRLREGQVEHTAVVTRMGLRTKLDGEWTEWLGMPPTEIAGTTTVTNVREDGTYDIEIVFTDVGVPASGQLPPEAMAELEANLASLIGLRQRLLMDDRGRILAAETSTPPGASTAAVQPAQIDAMSRELIDPLPLEPVGEDAVWEVERETTDAMGFAARGSNTLTLAELLPDGRLVLDVAMHMTAPPGPMTIPDMPFLDATIDRFSLDGGATRTVDLGLVHPDAASEGLSDYAFTVALGETSESTEMQMSMEFESRIVGTEVGRE